MLCKFWPDNMLRLLASFLGQCYVQAELLWRASCMRCALAYAWNMTSRLRLFSCIIRAIALENTGV
jgi:hypothetical protein